MGIPEKDMTKFGIAWKDWYKKIKEDWDSRVSENDIVLVGGDNAWPTSVYADCLRWIARRPGRIYFIEGNHCKWIDREIGSTPREIFRKRIKEQFGIEYIGESFLRLGNTGIMAQKLCDLPTHTFYPRFKEGVYDNERHHLANLIEKHRREMLDCKNRVFLSHYPPVDNHLNYDGSTWLQLTKELKLTHWLYGHYHDNEHKELWKFLNSTEQEWNDIKILNSSLDLVQFKMRLVLEDINQ